MSARSNHYDSIGELYERVKYIPTGHCERATFLRALPDLTGRSVLDVGSGTGFYARQYAALGARGVTGVDSSAEMVSHARAVEARDPVGIRYERHDATALPVLGSFDLVTAVWLLGYAEGEAALRQMVGALRANMAAGATLAVLFPNPDFDWDAMADYGRYGYYLTRTEPSHGRQGVIVHVLGDPPFEFGSYFWPSGVVESALEHAGLGDLRRHPTVVPDEALAEHGEQFWTLLRRSPSFAVVTATAP